MKSNKTKKPAAKRRQDETPLSVPLTHEELQLLQEKTRKAAGVLKKYHPSVKFLHLDG